MAKDSIRFSVRCSMCEKTIVPLVRSMDVRRLSDRPGFGVVLHSKCPNCGKDLGFLTLLRAPSRAVLKFWQVSYIQIRLWPGKGRLIGELHGPGQLHRRILEQLLQHILRHGLVGLDHRNRVGARRPAS
jgi:hypothetical protein